MKEFKVKKELWENGELKKYEEHKCHFVNGSFYIKERSNSLWSPTSLSDDTLVVDHGDGFSDVYRRIPSECPCTFTELLFGGVDPKPVPKKVKMSNDFSKDFLGKCPNCGLAFPTFLAVECHLNYCPSCGQKLELDWTSEKGEE